MFNDRPVKATHTGLRVDLKVKCSPRLQLIALYTRSDVFKDGDLTLRDVQKRDRGWYLCSASNPSGEQSQSSAYLDVLCKFIIPLSASSLEMAVNTRAQLRERMRSCRPR